MWITWLKISEIQEKRFLIISVTQRTLLSSLSAFPLMEVSKYIYSSTVLTYSIDAVSFFHFLQLLNFHYKTLEANVVLVTALHSFSNFSY